MSVIDLRPVVATDPVRVGPDDSAIWVHASDPQRSLILGTDKTAAPNGGLYVFSLDGKVRDRITGLDRRNNIDVGCDLTVAAERIDIAVLTERHKSRLRVFRIEPDGSRVSDISSGGGLPVS